MTSVRIEGGTGKGYDAAVTEDNQLKTVAESQSQQHYESYYNGRVYQAIVDIPINGNTVALHMTNDSQNRYMVATYIRLQTVELAGGTTLPDQNTYFTLSFDGTYSSGGQVVTPVNMRRDSGKLSDVSCYSNANITGDTEFFDRWYVESDYKEHTFNKEGSLILGFRDTMQITMNTDHTSGRVKARVAYMEVPNDLV